MVLKNSLASDFITSAMRGLEDCGAELQLASKTTSEVSKQRFKRDWTFMVFGVETG
jgi:hypothetical protein